MKTCRILAALLAALMLFSTLCACGEPILPNDGTDPADSGNANTEQETELTDDLPDDLNYNDDEIVILSRYREGWTSGEIAVSDLNGEPVNDAVYERNKFVEGRLGVKIISIEEPGDSAYIVSNKASLSVKSGIHE